MKKKNDRKIILLFVVVGLLLFGFLIYRVNKDFFSKNANKKQIDSIEYYGYTLTKSDTDIYKTTFKELTKVLNEKPIDNTLYAKLISKLFIIDLYTLDNKLSSTDIGGLEFGIQDLLTAIETVIAGKHIAEGDRKQIVRHSFVAEQLKTDEQGGDR